VENMNLRKQTHTLCRKTKRKQLLTTWKSTDDGVQKQLDYIMIDSKHHNWATQAKTKGTSNTDSPNQHRMILLKLRIKLKKEALRQNERKHITHDIHELRKTRNFYK